MNRYSYVFNRPLSFNDPSGNDPWWCTGGNCIADYYSDRSIADKRDLTTWLIVALVDSAESPEMQRINALNQPPQYGGNKRKAYDEFIYYVEDGAKYDVKDKIEVRVGNPTKIGNNWYEYSTAGNILYGFYGKAAGFTDFELHAGAGKAQIDDYRRDPKNGMGGVKTFFDTEDDYAAIGFGIYLYKNYYNDKKFTKVDLLDAFNNYDNSNKMAVRDRPRDFQPRYQEYPVDSFYQRRIDRVQ